MCSKNKSKRCRTLHCIAETQLLIEAILAGVTDGAQQTAVDQSLNEVDTNLREVVETLSELRGPLNNQYHNDGYTTATAVNLTEQVGMNSRLVEQQPQPYHLPGSSFHYKCPLSVPKFILHIEKLVLWWSEASDCCGASSSLRT